MIKKIIHIDMDCFYAQVEMRDRPELSKVPLAIGGPPHSRSVLCTSNYIARKFGVKSAMPTDTALRLCPELVILPPSFEKYKAISKEIHEILNKYSTNIEPISLDEAYLDVSHFENATDICLKIKNDIFAKTGLTSSLGLAPNKFLAKISSDWNKPNGIFVIKPHQIEDFTKKLPVKLIPGIGRKSLEIMESLNIETCLDIRNANPEILHFYFGKFSSQMIDYAYGIDNRIVDSSEERKSLSVEQTFNHDLIDFKDLSEELNELYKEMCFRLINYTSNQNELKVRKLFIKIKYNDFKKMTHEESIYPININEDTFSNDLSLDKYLKLLKISLDKRIQPIRLLGIGVRFLSAKELNPTQLSFFDIENSFCA